MGSNAQTILALNTLIQWWFWSYKSGGGALWGQRKCRGSQHRCLSCM